MGRGDSSNKKRIRIGKITMVRRERLRDMMTWVPLMFVSAVLILSIATVV